VRVFHGGTIAGMGGGFTRSRGGEGAGIEGRMLDGGMRPRVREVVSRFAKPSPEQVCATTVVGLGEWVAGRWGVVWWAYSCNCLNKTRLNRP
jgi:hypothetical protein